MLYRFTFYVNIRERYRTSDQISVVVRGALVDRRLYRTLDQLEGKKEDLLEMIDDLESDLRVLSADNLRECNRLSARRERERQPAESFLLSSPPPPCLSLAGIRSARKPIDKSIFQRETLTN